ncbi:hypothetical protein IRP63_14150 (plasmid) [Clostridium botulinum]|uniref:Uncharacterized protein n=1 Tax=Clostridium botulinum C/D str. DC5 TaxID=1443128 RepID=A0A0A0HYM2_CLOBO|nr:hypothetical protein [Clostridium botulinum]KGM93533.1 hypothetical protein Z955_14840 [Clostridium botulinum C/D str. DC5]KOC56867.1 hypothetical protein ADU89_01325 [Clostridium botulinum]KOC57342.1 hypothetical protein ADU90_05865 [Clostridium botulinum]MCD3232572.1 hypothetical protein [Clostridium botulinum D/C]MCD3238499.1 hypothetical protein [Clostridium botulinum D/C]
MAKKYLLLCNRHNSIYGDEWCLFWGCRDEECGYTSDVRIAHRFNEEEIKEFKGRADDIPIPVYDLGLPEDYISKEKYNENIRVMIEKGTLNKVLGLDLKRL